MLMTLYATGVRRAELCQMLTLKGATLLHVAAEFGQAGIAMQLLEAGANIDARATTDPHGMGGQTPIFHAATQGNDFGIDVVRLLLSRGADLTVRCQLPGHYEHPEEVLMEQADEEERSEELQHRFQAGSGASDGAGQDHRRSGQGVGDSAEVALPVARPI